MPIPELEDHLGGGAIRGGHGRAQLAAEGLSPVASARGKKGRGRFDDRWLRQGNDLNRSGHGSKPFWYHFGVFGEPPILQPILAGIGMFTRGAGF